MTLSSTLSGSPVRIGRSVLTAALLLSHAAWADCRHSADRTAEADAAGIRTVVIGAGAGDLAVRGTATARVLAKGRACASSAESLAAIRIETRRDGDTLHVDAILPDNARAFNHRSLDLSIELPAALAVHIADSSGDVDVENVSGVRIQDSSGDIDIDTVNGDVEISDSSGDVVVADVTRNVTVPVDSSGDLVFRRIHGAVHVRTDSSGGITASEVNGDVSIDSDSSGDIRVSQVGGDFTVANDSSGDIEQRSVLGKVTIPRNKRDD
jgi:Putative adhesin